MNTTQIVYKALRTDLTSAVIPRESSFHLQYKLGEVVTPKFGKLFCFQTLEDAEKFAWSSSLVIWEAEATNCERIYSILDLDYFDRESRTIPESSAALETVRLIQNWWTPFPNYPYDRSTAPAGSLTCDSLKLIQKILCRKIQYSLI